MGATESVDAVETVRDVVHYHCDVLIGPNWDGKNVVELRFTSGKNTSTVVIDRPTAARLINQLRRGLDSPTDYTIG